MYDVDVDTSLMSPTQCAEAIGRRLAQGPGTAFAKVAALAE